MVQEQWHNNFTTLFKSFVFIAGAESYIKIAYLQNVCNLNTGDYIYEIYSLADTKGV